MTERVAFGAELRRARERRGLTLDAIAEQTKVSATHFAGLERADLSRWPSGIFRRAFVRNYALAVGLDPEETVARFTRLFPDPSGERRTAPAEFGHPTSVATPLQSDEPGLRLALEPPRPARAPGVAPVARRALAGVLDISVAVTPAALVALAAGAHWFWPIVACVAMSGHLACYAALGTTPGAWLMNRLSAPTVQMTSASEERRRDDTESLSAPRRRVTRQSASRPSHAHRVRH
jgi:transcriptional regulator with XRE-family HTH domain